MPARQGQPARYYSVSSAGLRPMLLADFGCGHARYKAQGCCSAEHKRIRPKPHVRRKTSTAALTDEPCIATIAESREVVLD